MDHFVCVRIVDVSRLDLSLFQFDPDLTFAAFFLNADGTVYGRFGTRSDFEQSERDISLEGLNAAMDATLQLHKNYPANVSTLTGKIGPKPAAANPSSYPWIAKNVPASCIHCHHISVAERMEFRSAGKPLPEKLLFIWPMPDVVGLQLDPNQKSTVKRVLPDSAAERAGFEPGDEVVTFAGQVVLSTADLQWVLANTSETAKLETKVLRASETRTLTLTLEKGWRRNTDISWRPSTWYLRSILMGGLGLEDLSADQRREAGIADRNLALRHNKLLSKRVPAYLAGFRRGDIIVNFDALTDRMSEAELLAYTLNHRMPGDEILVTVLRAGTPVKLKLVVK